MKLHFVALFAATTVAAFGQTDNCWKEPSGPTDPNKAYGLLFQRIRSADESTLAAAVDQLVNIRRNIHCFAEFAGRQAQVGRPKEVVKSIIRAFENSRTDKQAGASASGAGTTSAVSRGAAAKALGFAVENGALTQSVKGQVVTFTGNLAGVPMALVRKDLFPYCDPRVGDPNEKSCLSSASIRFLRKISFGVSFDASRDSQTVTASPSATAGGSSSSSGSTAATPVTFQAARKEISSVTGRFEIVNHRDVTSKEFQKVWLDKMKTQQTAELKAAGNTLIVAMMCLFGEGSPEACGGVGINLLNKPEVGYAEWRKHASEVMIAAQRDKKDLSTAWSALLSELVTKFSKTSIDFQDKMEKLRTAFQVFDMEEDSFIDAIGTKPLLTFEYVNNRPVAQTPVSTFRLIGEFGWEQKNNLTFNIAAAVFDASQPQMAGVSTSRLRDLEAGLQYERKLGKLGLLGAGALDFSYYYQNQRSDSILTVDPANPIPGVTFVKLPADAKTVFAKKGTIHLGQIRLVLGPEKSNVKIPLAISYSNRTELIDKPTWRAQVGISYDFDTLFAK